MIVLRNMIFYTVVGGALWKLGDKLGAGLGINLALSLLIPPLLIISYTVYKNRGPLL
jgi:hypothetical protein